MPYFNDLQSKLQKSDDADLEEVGKDEDLTFLTLSNVCKCVEEYLLWKKNVL